MSKELQFDENISPYKMEKLKLLFAKIMTERMMREENGEGEINGSYCPTCKNKLKELKIPLKDGEILCDHCNNKPICSLYLNIHEVRMILESIEFFCNYFIPDYKYLK